MSDDLKEIARGLEDQIVALVKDHAAAVWTKEDSKFVRQQAKELSVLGAKMLVAKAIPSDSNRLAEIERIGRAIKIDTASMLLRIDKATLKGGNAFRALLARSLKLVSKAFQRGLIFLIERKLG